MKIVCLGHSMHCTEMCTLCTTAHSGSLTPWGSLNGNLGNRHIFSITTDITTPKKADNPVQAPTIMLTFKFLLNASAFQNYVRLFIFQIRIQPGLSVTFDHHVPVISLRMNSGLCIWWASALPLCYVLSPSFCFLFWNRLLLDWPGWPWLCDAPALASK